MYFDFKNVTAPEGIALPDYIAGCYTRRVKEARRNLIDAYRAAASSKIIADVAGEPGASWFEQFQSNFLQALSAYDGIRAEYRDFYRENETRFKTAHPLYKECGLEICRKQEV